MHLFHKWGRYKEIGTAERISNLTGYIIAVLVIFERECGVCGLKEYKKVEREAV